MMDIQPGFDAADAVYVSLPLNHSWGPVTETKCPVTGKNECQDRKCELYYMDAPITLDDVEQPEWLSRDLVF